MIFWTIAIIIFLIGVMHLFSNDVYYVRQTNDAIGTILCVAALTAMVARYFWVSSV